MIAVILPIYNQEKYLARALDSLAAQTDRDFMAICVNDGSTDATAAILADYATRRVLPLKIVTRANGGVSSARNTGLEAAIANPEVTHVTFLDPDDLFHPQAIEIMHRFADENPGRVVEWGVTSDGTAGMFLSRRYTLNEIGVSAFRLAPSVCTKLFPIAAVRKVRFSTKISIAEDMAFGLEVCHRSGIAGLYLPVELTYYSTNPVSTMHRPLGPKDFVERRNAALYMTRIFADDSEANDRFCRRILPGLLKRFMRDLDRVPKASRRAAWREFAICLGVLRREGRLLPRRGSVKDFKYYLLFLFWSYCVGRGGR